MVSRFLAIPPVVFAVLAGCGGDEPEQAAPSTEMEPTALLVRASLDIRGVRPNVVDLERVENDPAEVDALIEEYLQDDRFGQRVANLYEEVFLTRTETYYVNVDAYAVDGVSQASFIESVGDEPLQILAHVADNDLPYTELVMGDWTMANETLALVWPVDYPDGSTGWVKSTYTDNRPAAGVLATNSMWWRYTSTTSNANRKRANAVSRIFLCNDYLLRPIDFDRNVNLLDEEAVLDALNNNPACVNCHNSLDPLASYFYGFWYYNDNSPADVSYYHPERELRWEDYTGIAPAFYGEPGYSLADLGRQVAGDSRFPQCAAETAFELLLRRDADLADTDQLTDIREDFLEADLTVRSLFRSVMSTPEYRTAASDDTSITTSKMVTPTLLASQVEDLTGFSWTYGGYDMLRSDYYGFRTLSGGADGYFVTKNARGPNATVLLVQERLAEAASAHVVAQDVADPSAARLFVHVDFTETPDSGRDAMVEQLQFLHFRIFGNRVEADGQEVEANLELWADLYEVEEDTHMAWAGVLSALLRDPDFLTY